jgi:hypothetical protein
MGTAQLKQFEVFYIMGVLHEHRKVDMVYTVRELRALPLGLGGAAMRRILTRGAAAGA